MRHLSASEIVDSLDGALPPDRQSHADACERCRDEVRRVAASLQEIRGIDAPEPSRLFWDGFGGWVRAVIADERPRRMLPMWVWVPATALLVIAVVTGAAVLRTRALPTAQDQTRLASATPDATPDAPAPESASAEWAFITDVADALEADLVGVAAFELPPGAAEHAVLQLSDDQRAELARLLQTEIERKSS